MSSFEILKCDTAEIAIYQESPSLVKIKKELGGDFQLLYISSILTKFVKKFNIGKNMNLEQIADAAKDIARLYYFMKPSELKYVLNKAKAGGYGKIYDRLDGPLILEWLNTYMEEREAACARHQEAKNLEYKKDINEAFEHEQMKEIYETIKKQPIMKKEKKTVKSKQQTISDVAQSWLTEFDKLERKGSYSNSGGRFVKVGDKIMSQDEFFNHKLNEYNEANIPKAGDE